MGILLDFEGEKAHQMCSFMWADTFWIMSHSKRDSEQMQRDLIEEAAKWDMAPEEEFDLSINTKSACHRFSFEEKIKILGYALNRQEKALDAIEEIMQVANKVFWKNILIFKSKDVSWKIKCRRLVDHVYAVFFFWGVRIGHGPSRP